MNRIMKEVYAMLIAFMIFIFWLLGSWGEVWLKNSAPEPEYSKYNAWILFTDML